MSNHEDLIEQANQKYEMNAFQEASQLYRQAAQEGMLASGLLGNLNFSEAEAFLSFKRDLVNRFPENLDLKIDFIFSLFGRGYSDQVFKLCTQMLSEARLEESQK